jgi:hypothetical protein
MRVQYNRNAARPKGYALAAELGCYSDHWFETVHTVCGADLTADAMRRWFGHESPFRLRTPGGWHVLVIEELEEMNKTVHGLAKVAFERGVRDFGRLVVVATSNGAGRLSGPLLQRFDILAYSGDATHGGLAERAAGTARDAGMRDNVCAPAMRIDLTRPQFLEWPGGRQRSGAHGRSSLSRTIHPHTPTAPRAGYPDKRAPFTGLSAWGLPVPF